MSFIRSASASGRTPFIKCVIVIVSINIFVIIIIIITLTIYIYTFTVLHATINYVAIIIIIICIITIIIIIIVSASASDRTPPPEFRASGLLGLYRHRLNGYLVLQGNIPFRTAQSPKTAGKKKARYQLG